jgi:hypothetical protein
VKKRLWLGTFEEALYEKFTEEFKIDRRKIRTVERHCLRCDRLFLSLVNRLCDKCNGYVRNTLDEN